MKIKVCGITNNSDIRNISKLNPDYMGFIFHKDSPRDISGKIDRLNLNHIQPKIKKVAVFVNQPLELVINIIKKYRFESTQLHGDETGSYCSEVKKFCEVIKAFRVKDMLPPELKEYSSSCDIFLFDTKAKDYGGTGLKFDHTILADYNHSNPFILSGGIGEDDLEYIRNLRFEKMVGVDLNSKFESRPGIKSQSSLRKFIQQIRS